MKSRVGQERIDAAQVYLIQSGQGSAAGGKVPATIIEKPDPQGLGHTCATIAGGASTHAQYELPVTGVQSVAYQLSCPASGGYQRVLPVPRNKGQPRGPGHLYHRRASVPKDPPKGLHWLPQWTGDLGGVGGAPGPFGQDFQGAVATIGHGRDGDLGLGKDLTDAVPDGVADLEGPQAAFEGLGRYYDLHEGIIYYRKARG